MLPPNGAAGAAPAPGDDARLLLGVDDGDNDDGDG